MDKKINLDDILNETCKYHNAHGKPILTTQDVKNSMMEFGRQLLELAHENSEVVVDTCWGQKTGEVWVDKESLMKTLEQVSYENK
jgi:hypothetical protein